MNLIPVLLVVGLVYDGQKSNEAFLAAAKTQRTNTVSEKIQKSQDEWKKSLAPMRFYVLRQKGTERPFSGKYNSHSEKGLYLCAGCGNELFGSEEKIDSHCGWPSFSAPVNTQNVAQDTDTSHNMVRTEITCSRCGGHLGHLFKDGPGPTGLRYCINSTALDFKQEK